MFTVEDKNKAIKPLGEKNLSQKDRSYIRQTYILSFIVYLSALSFLYAAVRFAITPYGAKFSLYDIFIENFLLVVFFIITPSFLFSTFFISNQISNSIKLNYYGFSFISAMKGDAEPDAGAVVSAYLSKNLRLNEAQKLEANKLAALKAIDDRVERLSQRNDLVLIFIALILMLAVCVIIFAGYLTRFDAAAVGVSDKIKTEIRDVENRINNGVEYIQAQEAYNSANDRYFKNLSETKDKKQEDISSFARDYYYDKLRELKQAKPDVPFDISLAKTQIEFYTNRRQELNTLLLKTLDQEAKEEEKKGIDYRYFIATAITRVGVVLIIVFLVQILLTFYRYNTRVNTVYSSYADIVRLWAGTEQQLKQLLESFGPPKVDFGRDPKHPLQDVIKSIENTIRSTINRSENDDKSKEK